MEWKHEEGHSWPQSAPRLMVPEDYSDWLYIGHFEQARTYIYPDGEVVIKSPQALKISPSGAHKLTTHGDQIFYLPPGFIGIRIDGEWATVPEDAAEAQAYHRL